jgi:hypothetical protein
MKPICGSTAARYNFAMRFKLWLSLVCAVLLAKRDAGVDSDQPHTAELLLENTSLRAPTTIGAGILTLYVQVFDRVAATDAAIIELC